MKTKKEQFNEWKLIHNFHWDNEPIKKWVDENNFINLYKEDWNELMDVIDKICFRSNIIEDMTNHINLNRVSIFKEVVIFSKMNVIYDKVVEFIKWYNENQIKGSK